MTFFAIILCLLIYLLISPGNAYAWGPATHLEFANHALYSIGLFVPLVKKLLAKYPDHFLYGSVAADITIGKGLRGYLNNCHNWYVASDIYHSKAKKHPQKAFMLGYLAHLAADTVAHNFFIPFKMIKSWRILLLNHVYWEMRMDLTVPEKYLKVIEKLKGDDFADDDKLLENHLKRTIFSFRTNKKIFNNLLLLNRVKNYRKMARAVTGKSTLRFSKGDIRNYKNLAARSVVNFLSSPKKFINSQPDPTGKLKILYAKETAKKLKRAKKKGKLSEKAERRFLRDVKKQFKIGLHEPVTLPDIENYLTD